MVSPTVRLMRVRRSRPVELMSRVIAIVDRPCDVSRAADT
jgi:hypothetical protein